MDYTKKVRCIYAGEIPATGNMPRASANGKLIVGNVYTVGEFDTSSSMYFIKELNGTSARKERFEDYKENKVFKFN
jgi:hypothetical protein